MLHYPKPFTLTYILKLENNKWYVGKTANLNLRIAQHYTGTGGAGWTKRHKPIKIHRVYTGDREEEIYQKMRNKYGKEGEHPKPMAIVVDLEKPSFSCL